mmetsp:Transcript_29014/g.56493  ORF Transcript_29014/g.56493 Transcript_29014/m.56493 type:complete len:313 (-) Transcript_29014:192-1130(-)|eukprot:CAMPEP_0167786740 /NCGR_PEP_ID=MMETSP0111_2-20121227/8993_1 /TAXON_ID=91324 /ORGANISM="Lotharella globosa, Strain CCCM811" /LENGTH=312 /DNA_ID=CAMNT_0007678221 /DNA_START=36 /DNA_END=974 /DNA_ORIENTATION=-
MTAATTFSGLLNLVLGAAFLLVLFRNGRSNVGPLSSAVKAPMTISRAVPACQRMTRQFGRSAVARPGYFSGFEQTSSPVVQRSMRVNAAEAWNPPPVAATTSAFHNKFKFPLPMIFASFVSRLLTEQHFVRWNRKYSYNPIFALGVTSVFDQVFETLGEEKKTQLFDAFITALDESPATYRSDQAMLEEWAKAKASSDISPKADGDNVEQVLAEVSSMGDNFVYSKFFSIGLFRMLELTGAKDPKALESLVTSLNLKMDPVIRDLNYYKSSLSALIQAQELKREAEARAQKKREEAAAKKTEAIKKLANKQM